MKWIVRIALAAAALAATLLPQISETAEAGKKEGKERNSPVEQGRVAPTLIELATEASMWGSILPTICSFQENQRNRSAWGKGSGKQTKAAYGADRLKANKSKSRGEKLQIWGWGAHNQN